MNARLEINKQNLIHNFRLIKNKTSSDFVCPMVKADAYGVGDTLVTSILLEIGAKNFGVVKMEEALRLRRFFPLKEFDILLFSPVLENELVECVESKISLVLGDEQTLLLLEKASSNILTQLKPIHIKFNLGMSRLGFSFSQAKKVFERVTKLNIKIGGISGHFPLATDLVNKDGESAQILNELIKTAKSFGLDSKSVHALNSDAVFSKEELRLGVRPGISLYGVKGGGMDTDLKGVLSLKAPIIAIKKIKAGESVSYGKTWTASEESHIAVLPIGYADGLRRGLSNRISVKVLGQSYDQVGVICMDYTMINLRQDAHIKVGDNVVLFDTDYVNLNRWANLLGTIPYEILTGLGNRIERRVV